MLNKDAGVFDTLRSALMQPIPGTPSWTVPKAQQINALADRARATLSKPPVLVPPKGSRALGVIKVGHLAGQQAALEQLGLS